VILDSNLYGKIVIAPLNIVKYNVLSSKGPDLYGTEPWTFYFINGTLNFNLMFLAAILSPGLLLLALRLETAIKKKSIVIGTVFLWLGVFLAQPHKVILKKTVKIRCGCIIYSITILVFLGGKIPLSYIPSVICCGSDRNQLIAKIGRLDLLKDILVLDTTC